MFFDPIRMENYFPPSGLLRGWMSLAIHHHCSHFSTSQKLCSPHENLIIQNIRLLFSHLSVLFLFLLLVLVIPFISFSPSRSPTSLPPLFLSLIFFFSFCLLVYLFIYLFTVSYYISIKHQWSFFFFSSSFCFFFLLFCSPSCQSILVSLNWQLI